MLYGLSTLLGFRETRFLLVCLITPRTILKSELVDAAIVGGL